MSKTVMVNGEPYEAVTFRTMVDVKRDLPFHKEMPLESFFIVCNLDHNGERIGLQYQIIIMRVPGMPAAASVNVNLVNETTGEYKDAEETFLLDQVRISNDILLLEGDHFAFRGDENGLECYYASEGLNFRLSTKKTAPTLLLAGTGAFHYFGDVQQYDFAFPAMPTTGSIRFSGEEKAVTGITWLDRQWGDLPEFFLNRMVKTPGEAVDAGQDDLSMKWLWLCPQLSNGVNISVGEIQEMGRKRLTMDVTAVEPQGTTVLLEPEVVEKSDYWVSPATGNRYPTHFRFKCEEAGIDLEVTVPHKENEIVSHVGNTHYEGIALYEGTYRGEPVTGQGYVEMVGDWK